MTEKKILMYGTYKTSELETLRELYEQASAEYTTGSHQTNRGLAYYSIEGHVTPTQEKQIRDAVDHIAKTNYHWGKMTFTRMVW